MPNSDERPRVAAIIPVRNGAEHIDAALASLAAQTVPLDEVVVVDDASEDDTRSRIHRWLDILPLCQITMRERSGTWRARDTAIANADSDLILQLDADDIVLPHHVAVMTEAYRRRPGLIAPNRLMLSGGDGDGIPEAIPERLPQPGEQLAQLLILSFLGVGTVFSKDLYESVGGYRQCRYAEDWDLWIRMAAAGAPVSRPDVATYVYRMHPANISSNVRRRETDPEIIRKFLDDCGDPVYRQIAQLSLLVRGGMGYLAGLDRKAGPEGESFWEPDLGTVRVRRAGEREQPVLCVTSPGADEPYFTAMLDAEGHLEQCQVGAASRVLTTWPPFGEHFDRGRTAGPR